MDHDVVIIDAGSGAVALARPRAKAWLRAAWPAEGDLWQFATALERPLRNAMADPVLRGRLLGLLPSAAPRHGHRDLTDAVLQGRLLAMRLPATALRGARVRMESQAAALGRLHYVTEGARAAAMAALAGAGAPKDPLGAPAATVLAAWSIRRGVPAGAAAGAILAVCPHRRTGPWLAAAGLLQRAAAMLEEDAAAAAAALREAARLLGWRETLATLAQMSREFEERGVEEPAGEAAEAPPPPPPDAPPPPAAAPEPSELPGVDEAQTAEMLREAAKNGTPFCEMCEAARQAA